jgi:hypothetical protein
MFSYIHIDIKSFREGCNIYQIPGTLAEVRPEGNESEVVIQIDGRYEDMDTCKLYTKRYRLMMTTVDFKILFPKLKAACPTDILRHSLLYLDSYVDDILSDVRQPSSAEFGSARKNLHRSMAKSIDNYYKDARRSTIIAKRKAFRSLPAHYSSDLICGAWWYTLSSVVSTLLCIVVLANHYQKQSHQVLGTDDSVLPDESFQLAWFFMLASSVFFTIGSLIFTRACNDPPLPPLCPCRFLACIDSDELLGYWMFLMGIFPAIPYCMVYLVYEQSAVYFYGLLAVLFCIVAMLVFIYCSYRSDRTKDGKKNLFLRTMRGMCCNWRVVETHCSTDFLVLMWLCFWVSLLGMGCFVLLFLYEVSSGALNSLVIFTDLVRCNPSITYYWSLPYFVLLALYRGTYFYWALLTSSLDR